MSSQPPRRTVSSASSSSSAPELRLEHPHHHAASSTTAASAASPFAFAASSSSAAPSSSAPAPLGSRAWSFYRSSCLAQSASLGLLMGSLSAAFSAPGLPRAHCGVVVGATVGLCGTVSCALHSDPRTAPHAFTAGTAAGLASFPLVLRTANAMLPVSSADSFVRTMHLRPALRASALLGLGGAALGAAMDSWAQQLQQKRQRG